MKAGPAPPSSEARVTNTHSSVIAVIGFGSLIWRIRSRTGKLRLSSLWHADGPSLPVEYARISKNGRLTLVIVPSAEPQRTLWAYSSFVKLTDAKENLRRREGKVNSKYIGVWESGGTLGNDVIGLTISKWARGREIRGVVWTGLPPKDSSGQARPMTADEALEYLTSLKGWKRRSAKDYITRTPAQIDTEVRRLVRSRLGWNDRRLPADLFEN